MGRAHVLQNICSAPQASQAAETTARGCTVLQEVPGGKAQGCPEPEVIAGHEAVVTVRARKGRGGCSSSGKSHGMESSAKCLWCPGWHVELN